VLLFNEPLVWVGASAHAAWRRDPLPVAVYEPGSLARHGALAALAKSKRRYRIVYNSSSLVGHIAAVEGGLAVAVLTRCSMPPHLLLLNEKHGLPPLPTMELALLRSRASKGAAAVDAMHEQVLRTLRRAA
jgi:DNA-binding transcriptional LysR family regulator